MKTDEVVNLASDVPAMPERRRFLTLLGAGAALSAFPPNLSDAKGNSGKINPFTGPEWVFEEPPVVLDQDPSRVLLDQNENPIAPSEIEREAIRKAIELAMSQGLSPLAEEIEDHLQLYLASKPYIEPSAEKHSE